MRPKSIATVVDSLTERSAALEILRSVETTSISLTDWMNSVLPALKGPVTTIFTVCISALSFRLDNYSERMRPINLLTMISVLLYSASGTSLDSSGSPCPQVGPLPQGRPATVHTQYVGSQDRS